MCMPSKICFCESLFIYLNYFKLKSKHLLFKKCVIFDSAIIKIIVQNISRKELFETGRDHLKSHRNVKNTFEYTNT